MSLLNLIKGLLFVLPVLLAATLGVIVIGGSLLPLAFIRPHLFRMLFDRMLGVWTHYVTGLLELIMGVKVKISGDIIQPGERNLIIMNHRTRLDWMYFWSVLVRQSGVTTEKIILKSPLKKIPGIGWAMQAGAFIFINRNWEEDKKILEKMLQYFISLKHKSQILIFPEGTDMSPRTKLKSDEFARKNSVEPFEYVLHPRTTGFTFLTQYMRSREHLDAVYDVTIAYPENIPQQETDILTGNFPRQVHFHIKRHAVQSLPISDDGLQKWCKARWQEKEERLKTYYSSEKPQFKHDTQQACGDTNHEVTEEAEVENIKKLALQYKQEQRAIFMMKVALVYWTTFIVVILVILYNSALAYWLSFAQICAFVFITKKYGGFEFVQADYYKWFFSGSNKNKKLE